MYLLVLSGHLIGDYYLKAFRFMRDKNGFLQIFIQSLIYTGVMAFFFSFFLPIKYFIFGMIITLAFHFMVDLWDWLITRFVEGKPTQHKWKLILFMTNLLLHFIFYYLFLNYSGDYGLNRWGLLFWEFVLFIKPNIHISKAIQIIFGYLFLLTPSSFLMRYSLNAIFHPSHSIRMSEDRKDSVGTIIGNVERMIVFTLGIMDLFPSIALVITAKSLARFKQLEDKSFAERYLIGTLLSFLIALLSIYFLLM